jgi:hypothetical protein
MREKEEIKKKRKKTKTLSFSPFLHSCKSILKGKERVFGSIPILPLLIVYMLFYSYSNTIIRPFWTWIELQL